MSNENEILPDIVGTKIRQLPKALERRMLDWRERVMHESEPAACYDYKDRKLIVSYSAKRAAKDRRKTIEVRITRFSGNGRNSIRIQRIFITYSIRHFCFANLTSSLSKLEKIHPFSR